MRYYTRSLSWCVFCNERVVFGFSLYSNFALLSNVPPMRGFYLFWGGCWWSSRLSTISSIVDQALAFPTTLLVGIATRHLRVTILFFFSICNNVKFWCTSTLHPTLRLRNNIVLYTFAEVFLFIERTCEDGSFFDGLLHLLLHAEGGIYVRVVFFLFWKLIFF